MLDSSNRNLLVISTNMKMITGRVLDGGSAIATLLNDPAIPRNLKASLSDVEATLSHLKGNRRSKAEKAIANFTQFSAQLNTQGNLVNDIVTDTVIYNNLRNSISQPVKPCIMWLNLQITLKGQGSNFTAMIIPPAFY